MSPAPGRQFAMKGVVSEGGVGGPSLSVGRKPFDWMTDMQRITCSLMYCVGGGGGGGG